MSCIRSLAMAEPLVDVVEPDQIATSAATVVSVDIRAMSKEDATFRVPFSLTAQRNDYVHAIVAYFDTSFTLGHKPLNLTTSPRAKPTHWKQTVFYLEDTITMCQVSISQHRVERR